MYLKFFFKSICLLYLCSLSSCISYTPIIKEKRTNHLVENFGGMRIVPAYELRHSKLTRIIHTLPSTLAIGMSIRNGIKSPNTFSPKAELARFGTGVLLNYIFEFFTKMSIEKKSGADDTDFFPKILPYRKNEPILKVSNIDSFRKNKDGNKCQSFIDKYNKLYKNDFVIVASTIPSYGWFGDEYGEITVVPKTKLEMYYKTKEEMEKTEFKENDFFDTAQKVAVVLAIGYVLDKIMGNSGSTRNSVDFQKESTLEIKCKLVPDEMCEECKCYNYTCHTSGQIVRVKLLDCASNQYEIGAGSNAKVVRGFKEMERLANEMTNCNCK